MCAGTSPRASIAVVQSTQHRRPVDLGGKLLAPGELLEDEGLAAEERGPKEEQEERSDGHGAGE